MERTECFLGSDLTSTPESPKASASTSTALRVRKRWCAHGQPRALENLSKSPQFKCPKTPCKQCNDVASIGLARLPHDRHDSTRPHDKKPGPCSQHNPSVPTQQHALEEERSNLVIAPIHTARGGRLYRSFEDRTLIARMRLALRCLKFDVIYI